MSDPAKTPEEIEDVLASIRRLVSDNSSTTSTLQPIAEEAPAPVAEDRLVLTPSFRVADPEDPWVPVESAKSDLPKPSLLTNADTATRNDLDWHPNDRLASFDEVGDDLPEATEPSEKDMSDLVRSDGAEAAPADFESETGDDNWPGPGAESALLTLVARREPAASDVGDEAPDAEQSDVGSDVGLHGGDNDARHETDLDTDGDLSASALPEEKADEPASETSLDALLADAMANEATYEDVAENDEVDEVANDTAVAPEDHQTGAGFAGLDDQATAVDIMEEDDSIDLEPTLEDGGDVDPQAEMSDADIADDREDQREEGAAPHGPSPTPVFSARTKVEHAVEPTSGDPVDDFGDEATPFNFPDPEDGILDEETLREIIVDVVREELQGVLGQRITRNVRKMVRREVRLALAAEDLE